MEFLGWKDHIEGLERVHGFRGLERQEAEKALRYLQIVLGDDFLRKCCPGDPVVARHPVLMLLANCAPSSRLALARFADYVRALQGSDNIGNVLARLRDLREFGHDALLIKTAAGLVGEGLRVRFEPTMPVANNRKQPDLKVEEPLTGEAFYLEVVTQGPARRMDEAIHASSAVVNAVFGVSLDLCFSGRWRETPSEQNLADVLKRVKESAVRALNERTMVFVEEGGILEMALCHSDGKTSLLDPWSRERGLSCGFLGPDITRNDTVRLRRKIRREQQQLPRGYANVIVILAPDTFLGLGGVPRVIREVEDMVFKYDHVHVVIVHGEHIDDRKAPFSGDVGGHGYTRRILDGTVENNLLLVNRDSRMKLSPELLNKLREVL
jgi:hypothetical protein